MSESQVERPHFVILSVDAFADTSEDDACLQPPKHGEWVQTEGDEQYEFDYLAGEFDDERYKEGKHRKWCGELSEDEFDAWLQDESYSDRADARSSSEPTMGSITQYGHMPAYALNDEPMDWNIGGVTNVIARQAYVTEYAFSEEVPDAEVLVAYGIDPAMIEEFGGR